METNVKTPHEVFYSPQRLLVPLFQRPYVWDETDQWLPLWEDVCRVADRLVSNNNPTPHFLGAVVLQQQPNTIGSLQIRTIIDGQQRLTTLQLLISAVEAQMAIRGFDALAQQARDLVENQSHFVKELEDRLKVWPTNRDRAAFEEAMLTSRVTKYSEMENKRERLVEAHKFFAKEISSWLDIGDVLTKSEALILTVSRYLQVVVIELRADEDAQEIFETLNARGTPLTAADLIKNFVFQRLEGGSEDSEKAYQNYWADFETAFWEQETSVGRVKVSRSSLFLTQWLIAQTKEDITAREVFIRFKRFVSDSPAQVSDLLPTLRKTADVYKRFTEGAQKPEGELSRLELFVYRLGALESESVKPLLIWLTDPTLPEVPKEQSNLMLNSLESWFVRRALVRATTKRYNQVMVDLLREMSRNDRQMAGEVVQTWLAKQTFDSSYWPSDSEIKQDVTRMPIYRRLSKSRLRMLIEALEDDRRGFNSQQNRNKSEGMVIRGSTTIEHLMPQKWRNSWFGPEVDSTGLERDVLVHTLGNLTLLTGSLNSDASNSSWAVKQQKIGEFSTLKLTQDVLIEHSSQWGADEIHSRTELLINRLCAIWPVPESNQGLLSSSARSRRQRVTVSDLLSAGFLSPQQKLFARVQAHKGHEAFVTEDGGIQVNGVREETLSAAARRVTGSSAEDGWWFWVTDLERMSPMRAVRRTYREHLEIEDEDDDLDED